MKDLLEAGEKVSGVVSGIQQAYSKVRELRLKQFVSSCDYAFHNSTEFQTKQQFAKLFCNEFSSDHVFDFVEGVLKCYSKLARTAIGYMYVKCQSRGINYLTRDEAIILRALVELDDVDAQNFLFVIEHGASYSKKSKADEVEFSTNKTEWYYLDHNFYDENMRAFEDIGIMSKMNLKSSLEYFFVKRVLIANTGLAGGQLVDLGIPPVGKELYLMLKWASSVQDKL